MAQFNFQTDLKVEIWAAPVGAFIIGVSQIGGTDVLSNTVYAYTDITSLCSEINISNGLTFIGVLGKPSESNISLTITGNDYDPRVNKSIRQGIPLKISAKDSTGTWKIIHHGRVRDIISGYNPELKDLVEKNTVQFNLDSPMSIASQSALSDAVYADGQYATQRMSALVANAGTNNPNFPSFRIDNPALSIIPDYIMGDREIYGETFGDAFNQCFDGLGASGWLTLNNQTSNPNGELVYRTRSIPFPRPSNYYLEIDNIGANIQINNIDLSTSTDDIVNVWNVSPTWDSTDVYIYKNQDSIDLYGQKTYQVAINYSTTTPTFNQNWTNFQYNFANKEHIRSVSVSPINYNDGVINDVAFVQAGLRYAVLTFVDTNISIDTSFLITRVSHTITPDYWNTDLELIGA